MDKGPNLLLIPPKTAKCRGVNHGLNLDDPNAYPVWNCEVSWCYMNGWPMVQHEAIKAIKNSGIFDALPLVHIHHTFLL